MAIKNSSATKGAKYYIDKVQDALISHGASGIQMKFDGQGRISAIAFALPAPEGNGQMSFQMPCEWRKTQQVLENEGHRRSHEDDFCYKVAWANLKDWTEAQMALYETEMVTMPQIFLPFMSGKNGQTLFEQIASNPDKFLLN